MKYQHWLGRLWADVEPNVKQNGLTYTSQIYTIKKKRFALTHDLRVVSIKQKGDTSLEFTLMYEQEPLL